MNSTRLNASEAKKRSSIVNSSNASAFDASIAVVCFMSLTFCCAGLPLNSPLRKIISSFHLCGIIFRRSCFFPLLLPIFRKGDTIGSTERRKVSLHSTSKPIPAPRSLIDFGALYAYLFCMMASNLLLSRPILGGALYLTGRVALLFSQLFRPTLRQVISRSLRRTGIILLIVVFLLLMALMMVLPIEMHAAEFWCLFALVLCIMLRRPLMRYAAEKGMLGDHRPLKKIGLLLLVQLGLLPVPFMLMLIFANLAASTILSLLGGFLVSGLFEFTSISRLKIPAGTDFASVQQEEAALSGVHAYRIFQYALWAATTALQITQVMTFTFIGVSADALILCMGIALLCTYAASLLTNLLLRRTQARKPDPTFLMTIGLVAWLYGLILFIRALDEPTSVTNYLSLALCTMGVTIFSRTITAMEGDMRRVAAFGIGHTPSAATYAAQRIRLNFASLIGQLIALLALTLLALLSAEHTGMDGQALFSSFSPLFTLPALALVAVALVFSLLFPMNKQHMEKLRRYMELQKEGQENTSLHEQLEAVVIKKSLKRYGIKILLMVLRPLYYHKIRGRENIHLDKDTACVFVCNHGEIYGPIVTNLYVPFSFRPWVTYEMMDRAVVADRVLNGTFRDVKWLPQGVLRFLVERIAAPVLVWIMKSVDSIPVYHDQPRKLMQTFRQTTAAMEAGDNILLFPENAATTQDQRYAREGVSEFFTGFTMIGQLYHNKTGKCAQFIPLYADKHTRTITFGVPTRYNPDIPNTEEKERLCAYLRGEMLRLAGLEEKPPR